VKKKMAIAMAVGLLGATCQVSYAQSSVTIYGVLDEGVNYISNIQTAGTPVRSGKPVFSVTSGVKQGNRLGFIGNEDLGGGLKAIFTLENGFDLSSGKINQGGLLFGRQAFVGLASPHGTVTLGRQYDSMTDFVGPFEAGSIWAGTIGAHPGDIDNLNFTIRTNNAIKYSTPAYGGFRFSGTYSFGGVAGDISRNQVWSLATAYTGQQFTAAAGYVNVRNPNLSYFGTTGNAGSAATNNLGVTSLTGVQSNPVFSGYASAHSEQLLDVGASYAIGALTLGGVYSNIRFSSLGDLQSGPNPFHYRGTAVFNDAEVSVRYAITPTLLTAASYNFLNNSGADGQDGARYHQVDLVLDYFLSKRTDVYLLGIVQKASGHDSTGQSAVASVNTLTPSNSDRMAVIRIGLRQKF